MSPTVERRASRPSESELGVGNRQTCGNDILREIVIPSEARDLQFAAKPKIPRFAQDDSL